ncbi:kinase-like domain-containing protein [Cokeromyces recurvatus]|uniref:kinase-like domain-containing protein n=1 Tax=Cokeromyces recurvatus TaxID=90255 RepID=UPI00221E9EE9|nr:kinase-like domain-containing protein [Cokeromyces recurvatus]KAI7899924.1 kinase-like domain-containing protein [Cokeromyces recurvatus]
MELILDIKVIEHPVVVNDLMNNTCRTVPEFNIIVKTKTCTTNLIRYVPDFINFNNLVKTHYQKVKVPFPTLTETIKKKAGKRRSIRNLFFHMSVKSNAKKIEKYLWFCSSDPLLKSSTLLRDFFSPQREGDFIENDLLLQSHDVSSDDQLVPSPSGQLLEEEIEEVVIDCHSSVVILKDKQERLTSPRVSIVNLTNELSHHSSNSSSSNLLDYLKCQQNLSIIDTSIPLEHLEMVKVLGKGCMGKVILVRSKKSKKIYALKSIIKEHVIEQREITHTLDEKDILVKLSQINHPYLAKLYTSFQDEYRLYLLTTYYSGGDIATYMARLYSFSHDCALFYAAEIIEGIGELHRLGILYRDLKPENILLTNDGHIILTDFGLSKWLVESNNYTTHTFCGTAEYLAPEVLLGEPYSFTIDYWSFGTILYEMLAGITPFWADNHADMYRRVLEDPLEFPGDIFDFETAEFLTDILDRDPRTRLGANGVQEIKEHVYFADINWDDIKHRRLQPPYLPSVTNELDFSNFDPDFLAMTPALTPMASGIELSNEIQDIFDGYSFTDEAYAELEYASSLCLDHDDNNKYRRCSLHEDGFYQDHHQDYLTQSIQPARKRGSISILSNIDKNSSNVDIRIQSNNHSSFKDEEIARYAKRRNTNTSEEKQSIQQQCMLDMRQQQLLDHSAFSTNLPVIAALMEFETINKTKIISKNKKITTITKSFNSSSNSSKQSSSSNSSSSSKVRKFFSSFLLSL